MIVSLQSSLGIQFGEDCLTLVYLKKFLKEVVLDSYECISQPSDAARDKLDNFYVREISRFVKKNSIGKENVWVGLPRNECLLRFITLPSSAEENLGEVVRYEMEKYISFPDEHVNFDFVVIERDADAKNLQLLLLVIKKEALERYLSVLKRTGIDPLGIETNSTSLLNSFLSGKNGKSEDHPVALVEIGKHGFEVDWIRNGILRYSHLVDFTAEADSGRIQQIKEEIRNGFRVAFPFQSLGDGEKRNESMAVYLTGEQVDGEVIEGLSRAPEVDINVLPVEMLSSHLNAARPIPQNLTSTIGLALKGIKKVPWDINLLPQRLRKKPKKAGLYLSIFLFVAISLLSLTWGISTIVKERLLLRNIEKEIASLKSEVLSIQNIQQEAQNIVEEIKALEEIQDTEPGKLMLLKELSTILPDSVWLTNLRYYKKELQLSGYAASASGLIAILDGSSLFHSSEFTAPITRDRKGQESFKVKTRIERR